MTRIFILLCGCALSFSSAATAQPVVVAPNADNPSFDAARKIEALEAQVRSLQAAVDELKAQAPKVTPTWKGAPQFAEEEAGFSFKPRGTVQMDAGFVGYPNGNELRGNVGGLNYANLGFNGRARRILFGAEGSLPGGFSYSAEFNFAQAEVDYEDIILAYSFPRSRLRVQAGNFYPFSSLESMTSSRFTSFLERASITDAFNYDRRLGIGFTASGKDDLYHLQAGIFGQPINDVSFTRTGWQATLRGVYAPKLGSARLHLGANIQHRSNMREEQAARYRSRPLTQITDQRFIDTGNVAARGDRIVGVEVGATMKSLHLAAEAQKVWVRGAYDPAKMLALNGRAGSNAAIPMGSIALNGDPSFTGGYLEAGYFLTGETRGYGGGRWDRTKVLRPFNKGGWGAFQINGRVDYLELRDRVEGSADVTAPFYLNGGRQLGYQTSLIWIPIDYVRLIAQYGYVDVTGGPRAATIDPTSTEPASERRFGAHTAAVRAQVHF